MQRFALLAIGAALALSACSTGDVAGLFASTAAAPAATAPPTTIVKTPATSPVLTSSSAMVLADGAIVLTGAQTYWLDTCVTPAPGAAPVSFCADASVKSKVKAGSAGATAALATTRDAVKSGGADVVTLAIDAVSDIGAYDTVVADLAAKSGSGASTAPTILSVALPLLGPAAGALVQIQQINAAGGPTQDQLDQLISTAQGLDAQIQASK